MRLRRTRIVLYVIAMLALLALAAAWALLDPPPPVSQPGQTNLVASRVLKHPLAEVRAAIQAYCRATNSGASTVRVIDEPGESYTSVFVDCQPPAPRCAVPMVVRPWLMKVGWRPPKQSAFWLGMMEARWEGRDRTRLLIYQRVNDDTNTWATGRAYLRRIEAMLEKKTK